MFFNDWVLDPSINRHRTLYIYNRAASLFFFDVNTTGGGVEGPQLNIFPFILASR